MMVNYNTLVCFDSKLSYNTSVQKNISKTETARQNQKIPFHFLSAPPTLPFPFVTSEFKKNQPEFC